MPTLLTLLIALLLSTELWAQDTRPAPPISLERIVIDIRDARQLAKSSSDIRTREQLDLLLARAELAARELQRVAARDAAPPPQPRPVAMSAQDFARFMKVLSAYKFDDKRQELVSTLKTARLTTAQGKQIVQQFTFEKGKEDAAVAIYPLLVDPHLFAEVLQAMTFEQTRSSVLKRIAR